MTSNSIAIIFFLLPTLLITICALADVEDDNEEIKRNTSKMPLNRPEMDENSKNDKVIGKEEKSA